MTVDEAHTQATAPADDTPSPDQWLALVILAQLRIVWDHRRGLGCVDCRVDDCQRWRLADRAVRAILRHHPRWCLAAQAVQP